MGQAHRGRQFSMKDLSVILRKNAEKKRWYQTEKNTAALVAAVLQARGGKPLKGDDVWNLVRLCWITSGPEHWKIYKAPALGSLVLGKEIKIHSDHASTVDAAEFPEEVNVAARQRTGFVHFRPVWTKSSRNWCGNHAPALRRIVADTLGLKRHSDESRLAIATKLGRLPHIDSPTGAVKRSPEGFLTPLLACLDPQGRFPVINGRKEVQHLLGSLSVPSPDLTAHVKGMINLIGHFGLADALMIDVLADEIADLGPELAKLRGETVKRDEGSSLPYYDEAEREAVTKSDKVTYRARHDKMTNRLKELFRSLELKRGTAADCRYDVLLKSYDANGRDLLMEVKPDPDKGSLRIAIGQLFDYRRFLPRQAATDLAVLTISRPPLKYVNLLVELQITAVWFANDSLKKLDGRGQAWESLSKAVGDE